MGDGEFAPNAVAKGLRLRLDPKNQAHGFVEPDEVMTLEDYRKALHATRPEWSIDEG
jgi:hypothetical protein